MTSTIFSSKSKIQPSSHNQVRSKFFHKIGICDAPSSFHVTKNVTIKSSPSAAAIPPLALPPASSPTSPSTSGSTSDATNYTNSIERTLSSSSSMPNLSIPHSSLVPTRNLHSVTRFTEPLKYNHREEKKRIKESQWRMRRSSAPIFSTMSSATATATSDAANKKKNKRISFKDDVNVVPIPMRSEYSDRIRSRLWSNAIEIHQNAARNTVEFAAENWDWRNACDDDQMCICVQTGDLIHPVHLTSFNIHVMDHCEGPSLTRNNSFVE